MSEIEDIPAMTENWKTRLAAELEAKNKSMRGVSLAAGMAPGYIHSLLGEGKDPTVGHLLSVCDAAGISLYYVLYGVHVDPETEEIIRLLGAAGKRRQALLQILRDSEKTETSE